MFREHDVDSSVGDGVSGLVPPATGANFGRVVTADWQEVGEGTRDVYGKHLSYFVTWCEEHGFCPMPADPATMESYLTYRAAQVSMATVQTAVSAIGMYHVENGYSSPLLDRRVRGVMKVLAREYARVPEQVAAITEERFGTICGSIYARKSYEGLLRAQRRASTDIAIIGLMRDAMLHRSEASVARWCDLEREPCGSGWLTVPGADIDQTGTVGKCYVSKATWGFLDTMLDYRGGEPAKGADIIFSIGERQIANRIQDACLVAGLEGRYRGNSPRMGMVMDLAAGGIDLSGILEAGRRETAVDGTNGVEQWYRRHSEGDMADLS